MDLKDKFTEAFKKEWYIQGFNAYPLFLTRAGISGLEMTKVLGYGYTIMLYHYKKGYCEFHYLLADFKNIWANVKSNLKKDPKYVEGVAKKYYQIFSKYKKLFKHLDKLDLSRVSEKELFKLFHQTSRAMIDACGIAHSVDPIGIGLEDDFRRELTPFVKDRTHFNNYYSALTTPTKLSFLGEEERSLRKIARFSGNKRFKELEKHLEQYHWVNNSYAGPSNLTIKLLSNRLKTLEKAREKKKVDKGKLIKELSLSKDLQEIIKLIDFATIWQDRRKKNILISISYLNKVVVEISRRVNIPVKYLYYMAIDDVSDSNSLKDIKVLEKELEEREKGIFMIHQDIKEFIASGQNYQQLLKAKETSKLSLESEDLHGSVANKGTAVGKVVICKDLESITKVQTGDVIVASMTRPEFMPALKKAAGIVTDEGGITCHAAIISRELGIPCVVGTKIATKVLQDGMNIEVRANHGFVRVLS